jgi:hypothetical protein
MLDIRVELASTAGASGRPWLDAASAGLPREIRPAADRLTRPGIAGRGAIRPSQVLDLLTRHLQQSPRLQTCRAKSAP